jgi:acyl-coenzyme A synthetase/AMP-(fatty) acid ligase
LAMGGTVEIVRDALALAQTPLSPTLVNTVPSAMSALVALRAVPPTVQVVNLAGEPLQRQLVETIFATTEAQLVCNLYGPTETTTYSTWVAMTPETGFAPHVGKPVANTRLYILDAQGAPAPIGVRGELYIGGAGVARGYLNQPALTAERFLRDPFAAEAGARMYRTGDIARWLADGNVEFLGRNDHQVKLRGFRIELGEIEARLAAHPDVRQAVVVVREDSSGEKRLIAYVTGASEPAGPQGDPLRVHLAATLPAHMLPSAYVRLGSLPMTPNGKVDRRSLPLPEESPLGEVGFAAPEGEAETALARLWSEVLDVNHIGRDDDFFALGGHSLLATKLILRIRQDLGVEISLRDVFEAPRLAAMAEHVLDAQLAQFDPGDLARVARALGESS